MQFAAVASTKERFFGIQFAEHLQRHPAEGTRYRDIRDTVRPEWKPCEWKSSAIGLLVPLGGWKASGIIATPFPGVGPAESPEGAFQAPARLTPRCGD